MSEAQLYLYLVLAGLLVSLLTATVFFWHTTRKMKKEVLVEMGLSMGLQGGLPSGTAGSQMVVHRGRPGVVDQLQSLETGLTRDSGLPSYEEAMKSRRADIGLDCQY